VNESAQVLVDPVEREVERRSPKRSIFRTVLGAAALLVVAVVAFLLWADSSACENLIRKHLIAKIEAATGGRVEIASFHWHLLDLDAKAGGLVIHGRESLNEAPYLQVAHLHVRIGIFGFLSPRILLRDLEIAQPAVHLIVYADGSTNQPQPSRPRAPGKRGIDALFDLQAGRVAVQQGSLDFENRATNFDFRNRHARFDFAANDVSTRLIFLPANGSTPEMYRLEAGARDVRVLRGDSAHPLARPAQGFIQLSLDLMRNAAILRSLRLTARSKDAGEQTLTVSGTLNDFQRPRWHASAQGVLDMRLLDPATGYPNSPEGLARLNLTGAGQDGQFRVDGTVHVDGGSYVDPSVNARKVGLDAHVHADPEQLLITSILARLHGGGELKGTVALDHWLPIMPGSAVLEAAPALPAKRSRFGRAKSAPPAPKPLQNALTLPPVNGKVTAEFNDVSLDTVLDIVGQRPFQHLGIDARLNGPATATWTNGDVRTLAVAATLKLNPSSHIVPEERPATGSLDGTYTQRDGAVDLRALDVTLPSSHVIAHGHLGAYPLSSTTAIAVDFESRDLGDFDTVFRDLGLRRNGRLGTAALPGSLDGQAAFHGTWSGSLLDPHLAGNLNASNITVELPANPNDKTGKPQFVHWDTVTANGSYSSAQIAIDRGELTHGHAAIGLEGTLTASLVPSKGGLRPSFDAFSPLDLRLNANGISVAELQALIGQTLPITGELNARLDVNGPFQMLNGSGWIELDHGAVYGEPIAKIRAQGKVERGALQLTSFAATGPAGEVGGSGTIDLVSHRFQLKAEGTGIAIGRIRALQQSAIGLTGDLGFSISGSGTLDDPHLQATGRFTGLSVYDERVGDLQFEAHTANRTLIYDLGTHFASAALAAHGETSLDRDYTTKANVDFSKFNISALLKMAHISLTGDSALAGTITIAGPLAHPDRLRGEARLQDLAVTLATIRLTNQGPVHATLANGRVDLDPLHITGEATDLHVQGDIDFKANKQVDLAASGSINLKLAETLDPDLTAAGTTTFQVEAHGPLSNPDLEGRIDFQNASLALEDLPNSLSQLHGTLEFNQNRLEVRSLTAMTGGGQLNVTGFLAYQNGIFADLAVTGKGVRIRYPQGVSSLADANLKLQGTQNSLLLSGNVMVTRFTVSPDLDIAALATQANKIQPVAAPDAPSNHVRLDVRVQSSPQLNFQNAYAKLAGDVDLRLRGTLAAPSLLGQVSITEGSATIAGTRYELQRGDITFNNPIRIEPSIDLNATARVEDYDITLGLHGSLDKMSVSYRSDPPLPEADVVALLALGRTQSQQQIYGPQQEQISANPTTEALLGGALNATVSNRVQKLFGAGAVKVDPNYLGILGNSTTRITVEEQLSKYVTLTYATDVNTTAEQLLQAEIAVNRHVSLLVTRDESGVFSMVLKAVRRYR
jgi:translocation and assembly module TamB